MHNASLVLNIYIMSNRTGNQHNRYQSRKQEEYSFFACLNCNRDEGQIDDSTFSSFVSRRDHPRISTVPRQGYSDRIALKKSILNPEPNLKSSINNQNKVSVSNFNKRKSTVLSVKDTDRMVGSNKMLYSISQSQKQQLPSVRSNIPPYQSQRTSIPSYISTTTSSLKPITYSRSSLAPPNRYTVRINPDILRQPVSQHPNESISHSNHQQGIPYRNSQQLTVRVENSNKYIKMPHRQENIQYTQQNYRSPTNGQYIHSERKQPPSQNNIQSNTQYKITSSTYQIHDRPVIKPQEKRQLSPSIQESIIIKKYEPNQKERSNELIQRQNVQQQIQSPGEQKQQKYILSSWRNQNKQPLASDEKINLQFNDKSISEIYNDKQVYDSYVIPTQNRKNSDSNGSKDQKQKLGKKISNFGNGKVNLKIRQTISIGANSEDSDHESVVLEHSDGPFRGILNPIDESEELENGFKDSGTLQKGRWLQGLTQYQTATDQI